MRKLVSSNTTKLLNRSSLLMKYSRDCTMNLESTPEKSRQQLRKDRITTKWFSWSCCASNVSKTQEPTTDSPTHRCEALVNIGTTDAMQIDLVPELCPSSGHENVVTAMDVLSRYLFAYPTTGQDAETIGGVKIMIMIEHIYMTMTVIFDTGFVFVSKVINEVAEVLGITIQHATRKRAQNWNA